MVKRSSPEEIIAALALRQHGVVTRAQLRKAGLSDAVIDLRIVRGLLIPLHRGVFQVGPIQAPLAREMAACYACGPRAVLGRGAGAALWKVLPAAEPSCNIDVLMRGGDRKHPGIRIHRVPSLRSDEITRLHGIPVTTPARTLLDLAAFVPGRELEQAIATALARKLTTRAQLRRLLVRWRGRRGAARLRAWIEGQRPALTRSHAEEILLSLVRKARLPEPQLNVRIATIEVDFYWPDERLVVEVDGLEFHGSSHAFENDRSRDLALTATGLRVVRVTWRQLVDEPEVVLARIAQSLVHR